MAELEQLALDLLVTPAVVFGGEPLDQRGDPVVDRGPSRPVRVGPFPGDQTPMPPQDAAGGDQPARPQLPWQEPDQRGETARAAQSSRGRGVVRPSTATSCRRTSSSASLEADERPSRTIQPQTRTKMR